MGNTSVVGMANEEGEGLDAGGVWGIAASVGVVCGVQAETTITRMAVIRVPRPMFEIELGWVRRMLKSLTSTDAIRYVTFVIERILHGMHVFLPCILISSTQSTRVCIVLSACV